MEKWVFELMEFVYEFIFFFNFSLRFLVLYNCKKDNIKRLYNICIYSYIFNFVEV